MDAKDAQTGLALRFVREFDEDHFRSTVTTFDKALMLAMGDERDITLPEKVADALTFLKSQVH